MTTTLKQKQAKDQRPLPVQFRNSLSWMWKTTYNGKKIIDKKLVYWKDEPFHPVRWIGTKFSATLEERYKCY